MASFYDEYGNLIIGKSPRAAAIESQERAGQAQYVKSSKLPSRINGTQIPNEVRSKDVSFGADYEVRQAQIDKNIKAYTAECYEKLGIKILSHADDLFVNVELPEGWEIKATDHNMWNYVYDENGRKRLEVFYKASWHDRSAFANVCHRYGYAVNPFDKYETDASYEERKLKEWSCDILDGGEIIKTLATKTPTTDEEYFAIEGELGKLGEAYMNEHYPGWRDFDKYWEEGGTDEGK